MLRILNFAHAGLVASAVALFLSHTALAKETNFHGTVRGVVHVPAPGLHLPAPKAHVPTSGLHVTVPEVHLPVPGIHVSTPEVGSRTGPGENVGNPLISTYGTALPGGTATEGGPTGATELGPTSPTIQPGCAAGYVLGTNGMCQRVSVYRSVVILPPSINGPTQPQLGTKNDNTNAAAAAAAAAAVQSWPARPTTSRGDNGAANPGLGTLGSGGDAAEAAVVIILMMVQDADQDLQSQMAEAEAQMAAKQAVRAYLQALQAAMAAAATAALNCELGAPPNGVCPGSGTPSWTTALPWMLSWTPCDSVAPCPAPGTAAPTISLCDPSACAWMTPAGEAVMAGCPPGTDSTPACASLESELAASAGCPPGTEGTTACTLAEAELLVSSGCTGTPACTLAEAAIAFENNLQTVQNSLQDILDSENEISEMTSMQLQMLMDMRSKLLQTASNIEKSMSDADTAISGNIKQ
jgi:hypothetical protein